MWDGDGDDLDASAGLSRLNGTESSTFAGVTKGRLRRGDERVSRAKPVLRRRLTSQDESCVASGTEW